MEAQLIAHLVDRQSAGRKLAPPRQLVECPEWFLDEERSSASDGFLDPIQVMVVWRGDYEGIRAFVDLNRAAAVYGVHVRLRIFLECSCARARIAIIGVHV